MQLTRQPKHIWGFGYQRHHNLWIILIGPYFISNFDLNELG